MDLSSLTLLAFFEEIFDLRGVENAGLLLLLELILEV